MKLLPKYLITTLFITMFILYINYPKPEVILKYSVIHS